MVKKGWPSKYKSGGIPHKTWIFAHQNYVREDRSYLRESDALHRAERIRAAGLLARVAEGVKEGKPQFWVFVGVK
jgi:hypothetical protein